MEIMRNDLLILCLITMLLSSCQLSRRATISTPITSAEPSATVFPSSTPSPSLTAMLTLSQTPFATETPGPTETITLTHTPIILPLTPAPTFNIKKLQTVTPAIPAPSAICPKEDPSIKPSFSPNELIGSNVILDYLNSGGMVEKLMEGEYSEISEKNILDVTGDGIKEIIYWAFPPSYRLWQCKDGKYQEIYLWDFTLDSGGELTEIVDLNQNGIPELIFARINRHGFALIYIYEWDGTTLRSLIKSQEDAFSLPETGDSILTFDRYQIIDTNGDGLKEMVLVINPPLFYTEGYIPYYQTIILGWDGENFVNLKPGLFAPPKYRFQAVLFGDMQTLYGNYQDAIYSYEAAIFSDKLEWWSRERQIYISQHDYNQNNDVTLPPPDLTERPKLAAYAYYRLMVLHIHLHETYAAKADYAALQEKFPIGNPGHPYVEMAIDFWEAYQSTQSMSAACESTYRYTFAHPELLEPFSSRGWWSHSYKNTDFCPF